MILLRCMMIASITLLLTVHCDRCGLAQGPIAAPLPSVVAEHNAPPQGFKALFNGKDLSGWIGLSHFDPRKLWSMSPDQRTGKQAQDLQDVRKHWRVEKGELVNDGHGVYLTTAQEYGDFELMIDYKTVPKADSGIYLRATPQVQIWDTTKAGGMWKHGADQGSGSLWNNQQHERFPLVLADKPFGEWNHFHIRMIDENVTVSLNNQLVVNEVPLENYWDRGRPVFPVGPIQLQTHGGEIRWRNIFIKQIPRRPPEAGVLDAGGQPVGDGWRPRDKAIAQNHPDLVSGERLRDFELHTLFRLTHASDTATVAFRRQGGGTAARCTLQIGAQHGAVLKRWHGNSQQPWTLSAANRSSAQTVRLGEPNHLYMRVRGDGLEAWLNGVKVLDRIDPNGPAEGLLALSGSGSDVQFENVFFRKLQDDPRVAMFTGEQGFVSIFNGKDLSGWTGAMEGHIVKNGVLISPKGGGGNLFYNKPFSDFIFRFEFALESNGNNGVGIRTALGKNAAYNGMELQILDNTGLQYTRLKKYQYHGSIYGVVPAKRGYQVPLGRWNREEIYAQGNHIRVTLNGKVIVDADLEQAGKPKTIDGRAHPGLFNKSGHIGFLGHGHRIRFRNLRVKELK